MTQILRELQRGFDGPFSTAEMISASAQPGDLIEFDRGVYSHYALSIGNGKVISVSAGLTDTTAQVDIVDLVSLAKAGGWSFSSESTLPPEASLCAIRSDHDDLAMQVFKKKARNVEEIVREAKSFLKRKVPYELLLRNCEYYCTLWKYGNGFSTQIINTMRVTGLGRYEKFAEHCEICSCDHNFNRTCHCGIDHLTSALLINGVPLKLNDTA